MHILYLIYSNKINLLKITLDAILIHVNFKIFLGGGGGGMPPDPPRKSCFAAPLSLVFQTLKKVMPNFLIVLSSPVV